MQRLWRSLFTALLSASLAAASAGTAGAQSAAPADAPRRVVSINACADQLLMTLGAVEQIASLSNYATDPTLSDYADIARAFPHAASSAESVIAFQPDLVLAGRATRGATRAMLKRLGYRVVELETVRSIDAAMAQVREVSKILGHPENGELLAQLIDVTRSSVQRQQPGPTAAVLQRRGYVTGGDTLVADLIISVGLVDYGGILAGNRGGFVSLEELVETPPDLLIFDGAETTAQDQGTALLRHPALQALFPASRRIELPSRLTACGGPSVPTAIRYFANEVRRVLGN